VRDCEGMREHVFSPFLSLHGVEPATLPRYYGHPIKAHRLGDWTFPGRLLLRVRSWRVD